MGLSCFPNNNSLSNKGGERISENQKKIERKISNNEMDKKKCLEITLTTTIRGKTSSPATHKCRVFQ